MARLAGYTRTRTAGDVVHVWDLVAEHRHVLLVVDGDSGYAEGGIVGGAPIAPYRVALSGTAGDLIDRERMLARQYGSASAAYLIRPDGYIACRVPGSAANTMLRSYLNRVFSSPIQ